MVHTAQQNGPVPSRTRIIKGTPAREALDLVAETRHRERTGAKQMCHCHAVIVTVDASLDGISDFNRHCCVHVVFEQWEL